VCIRCVGRRADAGVGGVPTPFQSQSSSLHCTSPVSYIWNFGDGTQTSSSDPNQFHAYTLGTFTWKLTTVVPDRSVNVCPERRRSSRHQSAAASH